MNAAHRLANKLYKSNIHLYRFLYTIFKSIQDRHEARIIRRHVVPGNVVLDIGANIGFYTRQLSRLVGPDGVVHAFEPDETNFRHLSSVTSRLPNVLANNKAVGRETGKLDLYLSGSLNVDHRTYKPDSFDKVLSVDVVSIDDYLKDEGRLDFIKMDIQGHEMEALSGMSRTLARNPQITMLSEYWPHGLRQAGGSAAAYFEMLQGHGFRVSLLSGNTSELLTSEKAAAMQHLGESHYFNILAVRP